MGSCGRLLKSFHSKDFREDGVFNRKRPPRSSVDFILIIAVLRLVWQKVLDFDSSCSWVSVSPTIEGILIYTNL